MNNKIAKRNFCRTAAAQSTVRRNEGDWLKQKKRLRNKFK